MNIAQNITGDTVTLRSVYVAVMLGHSISILLSTYAHFIPTTQDQAAQLMDDIRTLIPIEIRPVSL